jgi:hypothetical protein
MGVNGLPATYAEFVIMRQHHMEQNLRHSEYTKDLFLQYKKHLGTFRYRILLEAQTLVVPQKVREALNFRNVSFLYPALLLYALCKCLTINRMLRNLIMPAKYKKEIIALNTFTT